MKISWLCGRGKNEFGAQPDKGTDDDDDDEVFEPERNILDAF